jgi:hypothetical protein
MNVCTVRKKYTTAHVLWKWLFHILLFLLTGVFTESELCSVKLWMWNLEMFMGLTWLTILAWRTSEEKLSNDSLSTAALRSLKKSKLSNMWQECCTFGPCQSWPIVNIRIWHFLAFSLHEPQSPLALSACLSETIIQSYSVSVDSFLRSTLLLACVHPHIFYNTGKAC